MSQQNHIVVAIDGPAASGKSSVSREVARQLSFSYVNSGNVYRAVTWLALQLGQTPVADPSPILAALHANRLDCGLDEGLSWVSVDGKILNGVLSSEAVNANVSSVSALPEVRAWLLDRLRSLSAKGSLVMEGRDIGSVVFPDTPYKFYLDASPEIRESRRQAQGIGDAIAQRDSMDSSRKAAPLSVAQDAFVVDSSHLNLEQVVALVLKVLAERGITP